MTDYDKHAAVVICPGRGSYYKTELGYLKKYHTDKTELIASIDQYRANKNQVAVSELDGAEVFRSSVHGTGDNASALIYTCALADFLSIDRERFDIVAVTGNSMGWYVALACAGALPPEAAIHVVNTMGTLMHSEATGGQVVYPLIDEQWQTDYTRESDYNKAVKLVSQQPGAEVYASIHLGGMAILAANNTGVTGLLKALPAVEERYPLAIPNHGAFHSPLMRELSAHALQALPKTLFQKPELPLVDGRGHIWQPYATEVDALQTYTFGHQVVQPYDYSKAIEVAVKEYAPDKLIILGPGSTLGAPTAQVLLRHHWLGMKTKKDFLTRQKRDPFILSMGIDDQRRLTV